MKRFITTLSLLFFIFTATAQEYDYLTILKMNYDLHISIGSTGYEKVNIKGETDDKVYDLSAVNNRISSYEAEGWEFVSAHHSVYGVLLPYQVIMRRPKK